MFTSFFYASSSCQYLQNFPQYPHLFYFRKELSKTDPNQFLQVLVPNCVAASSAIGSSFLFLEGNQGLCQQPVLLGTPNQQLYRRFFIFFTGVLLHIVNCYLCLSLPLVLLEKNDQNDFQKHKRSICVDKCCFVISNKILN